MSSSNARCGPASDLVCAGGLDAGSPLPPPPPPPRAEAAADAMSALPAPEAGGGEPTYCASNGARISKTAADTKRRNYVSVNDAVISRAR
jgi:hypothetical protein